MGRDFNLRFRHSEGNLHVRAQGGFDADSARDLLELIRVEYRAGGRVFVDTAGLGDIQPSGRGMLDTGLEGLSLPLSALYFKGEKGFQVAPSGSRVLIIPPRKKRDTAKRPAYAPKTKKHCCGNCAPCACGHHPAGEEGHGGATGEASGVD